MTQREIVRTAIILGGIWLVISAFASISSMFVGFAETTSRLDQSATEALGSFFTLYVPAGLGGIGIGILPGIYAILSSNKWADRIVKDGEATVEVQPSLVLSAGTMLLGLSTGVSGAISLASSGLIIVAEIVSGSTSGVMISLIGRSAAYGICSLIAGILLFRWGSNSVPRAA